MRPSLAAAFALTAAVGAAVTVGLFVAEAESGGVPSARSAADPPATSSPGARAAPERRRFTVAASGDLLMHGPLLDRARHNGEGDEYDFAPFFRKIRPYVAGADLALCHVETPMGPGPPASYPIFNTPPDLARSIRKTGWDACSTASNHSLDQGRKGIEGTVAALRKRGVEHTGSFASERASKRPTILRVAGVRVGFISYTDATNGLRAPTGWALNEYAAANPKAGAKAILADARDARRAGAEAVIVNVHWGTEYASSPNASQLAVAKRLTDSTLITAAVGQHPHVVEPIERINHKFVVFSEGNLVSNQSPAAGLSARTQDGLIALLRFEVGRNRVRVVHVKYLPTWVRPRDFTVLPAHPSADPRYADALRKSRARTVAVAGDGKGVEPISGGNR